MAYTPWTTRTIGIEMEMTSLTAAAPGRTARSVNLETIASALTAGLANVRGARRVNNTGGYGHSTGRSWDVKTDSSCGFEVASPAFTLDAEGDSEELKAGCNALAGLRLRIDRTCGLHVWVNCSDFTWEDMQRLLALYARYEPVLFEMVPSSRRANTFCVPMRKSTWTAPDGGHIAAVRSALAATTEAGMRNHSFQKYSALNVSRWWANGMVEFRLHSGTVDYVKIRNWVKLLTALVNRVKMTALGVVKKAVNATPARDAERANGGLTTQYFGRMLGLAVSRQVPDVPASNVELLQWIEGRRILFNPTTHRTPTRGIVGRAIPPVEVTP